MRIRQQIDSHETADNVIFVRIFAIVHPRRLAVLNLQEPFHGGPFLIEIVAKILVEAGGEESAKHHSNRRKQKREEQSVAESQPESQTSCDPLGFFDLQLTPAVLQPALPAFRE